MGIELNDGKLYFIHNIGDVSKRIDMGNQIVSDGRQHKVKLKE